MIETPGPEDQNQEQPEPTAEQAPANPPETPIPQTEDNELLHLGSVLDSLEFFDGFII